MRGRGGVGQAVQPLDDRPVRHADAQRQPAAAERLRGGRLLGQRQRVPRVGRHHADPELDARGGRAGDGERGQRVVRAGEVHRPGRREPLVLGPPGLGHDLGRGAGPTTDVTADGHADAHADEHRRPAPAAAMSARDEPAGPGPSAGLRDRGGGRAVTSSQRPSRRSAGSTIQLPPTAGTAGSARYSPMLSAFTPPEGMNDILVNGAASARIAAGPPSRPAGKNLTSSRPRAEAAIRSLAVATPGSAGTPSRAALLHHVDRQAGADDEPGTGLHHLVDLVRDQDRARSDVHTGQGREAADRLEAGVGTQCDLDDVDPAGEQRLAQGERLLGVVEHDNGHDGASVEQGQVGHGAPRRRCRRRLQRTTSSGPALIRQLVAGGQALPVTRHTADGGPEGVAHPQALGDRTVGNGLAEVAGDEGVAGTDGVDDDDRPGRAPGAPRRRPGPAHRARRA